MRTRPIIAIDGPSASGKSSVARRIANDLGLTYLNTGAMYRAVAIAFKDAGLKPDDGDLEKKIAPILQAMEIDFDGEKVSLNGRDVTSDITRVDIGDLASSYSTLAPVRARMREMQRAIGEAGGIVMEGRDIGTVVFPDAEFKFYFEASAEIRAARRLAQLQASGVNTTNDAVLREIAERDRRDSARTLAPLRRADDAVVIDTSNLTFEEAVSALEQAIQGSHPRKRA
ncbi:MAG TPA: (d)CMP kinase [Candidatus Binataceae bacterium]|nr:(d)CMP kinase [Candidatus Binataceae bacterium]